MKSSSLDTLAPSERSERMSRVRGKDTKPEMLIRCLVHGMGYRYRLHAPELPGKPDLVFRPRKKVVFVHGCFWHLHPGCSRARFPKSPESADWWREKLEGNAARDQRNQETLRELGWNVHVIWECEAPEGLKERLRSFLGPVRQGMR